MQQATCEFAASAENVRAARRFVSEVAETWNLGELAWPLVQIVSELASNAVIHAGTDFTVHLSHDGAATRIEVVDHSARRAQSRKYEHDATTGRGLQLVEMLSREWGVSSKGKDKTVWAVLDASAVDSEPEALADLFLVEDEALDAPQPKTARRSTRGSTKLAA